MCRKRECVGRSVALCLCDRLVSDQRSLKNTEENTECECVRQEWTQVKYRVNGWGKRKKMHTHMDPACPQLLSSLHYRPAEDPENQSQLSEMILRTSSNPANARRRR